MDRNNYNEMLLELLNIEKRNDIFNLTRSERSKFEDYVKDAIRIMSEYPTLEKEAYEKGRKDYEEEQERKYKLQSRCPWIS